MNTVMIHTPKSADSKIPFSRSVIHFSFLFSASSKVNAPPTKALSTVSSFIPNLDIVIKYKKHKAITLKKTILYPFQPHIAELYLRFQMRGICKNLHQAKHRLSRTDTFQVLAHNAYLQFSFLNSILLESPHMFHQRSSSYHFLKRRPLTLFFQLTLFGS